MENISEDRIIQERKEKIANFLKTNPIWIFYVLLIILVIMGINIRMLPLTDHNGNPGLWDITTNDYTLGPDLDPFLFLRYAKSMVENNSLPQIDNMRNVPLGFDTTTELQMTSYMIVLTYKILNLFGTYGINYAGAVMPVWMFALTIIAFFFFVKEIFSRGDNKRDNIKAYIIAIVASLFMTILPGFLSRTVAGIPEKESVAFFFMFLSFYLFLKAFKAKNLKKSSIYGVLAGISTGLMGLTWGGVVYVYITLGVSSLALFILGKFEKKREIAYGLWIIASFLMMLLLTNRFELKNFFLGLDTGIACFVLGLIIFNKILWKTKLNSILRVNNLRMPKTLITTGILILIAFALLLIAQPSFIFERVAQLNNQLIKPITGRWNTTVAENRQPYFTEWLGNFGSLLFWILVLGSILLFNRTFNKLNKKDNWILTGLFILFFFGLIFSRYSGGFPGDNASKSYYYLGLLIPCLAATLMAGFLYFNSKRNGNLNKIKLGFIATLGIYALVIFCAMIFSPNSPSWFMSGENLVSLFFYYFSALILVGFFIYLYAGYHKRGEDNFERIEFEYIILFVLLILNLVTARGAVRLIMVLVPIAPIFFAYFITEVGDKTFKEQRKERKMLLIGILIALVISTWVLAFGMPSYKAGFYQEIRSQAYNYIPYYYTFQWQNAMAWVRDSTPGNSVFSHWWDYGYWLQSIGERPTVTDGANVQVWWNYLTGRLVLTGDNQKDALEFLYSHNASYFLIDSSDLGKYGAFSKIGSDANYDRFSYGPTTLILNENQIQETANTTVFIYSSGTSCFEEDLSYEINNEKIFIPGVTKTNTDEPQCNAYMVGSFVEMDKNGKFLQPKIVVYYRNQQYTIPIRYIYKDQKIYDFKTGINATMYLIPRITSQGQRMEIGAAIYISPRIMEGFLGQVYLLNDPFNNFPNFKLVHNEPTIFVDSLNKMNNLTIGEFSYLDSYAGLNGPIKIWKINYKGDEKVNPEYLLRAPPSYITWKF